MRQVPLFSGNWNNGSQAGSFYWNLNNLGSNSNRNIGAQAAFLPQAHLADLLVEYVTPINLCE